MNYIFFVDKDSDYHYKLYFFEITNDIRNHQVRESFIK